MSGNDFPRHKVEGAKFVTQGESQKVVGNKILTGPGRFTREWKKEI